MTDEKATNSTSEPTNWLRYLLPASPPTDKDDP